MARVHEFEAARAAMEPIIIRFSDGREYTFPGDIDAGAWLSFINEFAGSDSVDDELLQAKVMEPLLVMLCGQEQFEKIIAEATITEIAQITRVLWEEYMGLVSGVEDDEDGGSGEA